MSDGEQFGLRWHRLLFAADGTPAVRFGPVAGGDAAPAPSNHSEPMLTAPIDETTPTPFGQDLGGLGSVPTVIGGTPAPRVEIAASPIDEVNPFWHPPYSAPGPRAESPAPPASAPGDAAPPVGHIPKSEAVIWSGPAIVAFPPEGHDATVGATAPDLAGAGDAISRADLDPVLAAMGSGAEHGTSLESGADISAAFLPPDGGDVADPTQGLDLGFAFTPPPMPPPPDMI